LQIQKDERFLFKFCECVHFSFHVLQNTRLIKRLQFAFLVRAAAAAAARAPLYLSAWKKIKSFSSERLATTKRTAADEKRFQS
jgi:hypothetical protein